MRLTATEIDIGTGRPIVLLNSADAETLGVHALDRVELEWSGGTTVAIVKVTDELLSRGELGVTSQVSQVTGEVAVQPAPQPPSVESIRRKLDDEELDRDEIEGIVADVNDDRLSDLELSAYVCATYASGLSLEETKDLTEAMADVGEQLSWDTPLVADKHSIGGVAGNRVTPIMVPIVAAAGITIPKTSSRAVTSPSGTADTMEVFCPVEFPREEIVRIVEETNGCLVWGGAVDLSPVDDKVIRAETPLSLDPPGQVIASVLSKKESAGSSHIVIDVPYGEGAKVSALEDARRLADDFKRVGEHLGLHIECAITRGSGPIGRGIGPVLEARDVLSVLEGDGPGELRLKSVRLANILFELAAEYGGPPGIEDPDAAELIDSGAALSTFREIVAAQGGDPAVDHDDLIPGQETATVTAASDGIVTDLNNAQLSRLARRAGAPADAGAGIYLHHRVGDPVEPGDDLYTVHAESPTKLEQALEYAETTEVARIGGRDEALVERV